MAIELTVLGSSGSHTGPGTVCSGYLLRSVGAQVMVDAGNGASANLQLHTRIEALDAIVVSHQHVDHCVDLIGMYYALKFGPTGPNTVPLYAAPEVIEVLTGLLSEDSAMEFREVFDITEIGAGDRFEVGPFRFELYPSVHPVPTVSMRIVADGAVLAYSGDSAGGPDLLECARNADLFLCEATWQGEESEWPDGIHLTARGAGRMATEANVARLVLTHVLGGTDRERSLVEARETFAGEVGLAEENETWMVG